MRESDSVAVYFVQAMIYALRDQPKRVTRALELAGIDPALLGTPDARIPASAFSRLWLNQIRELNDEFFLLDSRGMLPGSFSLICRALIQETTLERAMRGCLANFSLFLKDFHGVLEIDGSRAVIRLHGDCSDPQARQFGEEALLVFLISLLCWLGCCRIPIERTDFRHTRESLSDEHLLWGSNLNFGAPHTEIEFASSYLRLPVSQDLVALKRFLRTAPQWLVVRFRNQHSMLETVTRRLRKSRYSEWPSLQQMAQEQGLSISTFRRQLEREGWSFQEVKNEVRRNRAVEQLRDSSLSLSVIADHAGFQEASALHRAFKKWTGESPGSYRARYQLQRSKLDGQVGEHGLAPDAGKKAPFEGS